MKPIEITWKSTYAAHVIDGYKDGVEYRVLFRGIPDYLKEEWLKYADGICPDSEKPGLEIQGILMPNGDICNIEIKYYFDNYKYFELTPEDEDKALDQFIEFIRKNDNNLLDAYNAETDELMGDLEWELLAYK